MVVCGTNDYQYISGKLYDLTGKTVIPFATSGGSGMGKTNEKLSVSCKGGKLLEGKVFKENVGSTELLEWATQIID